jgi:exopolyphosphatase/pppGpp-phosphohydrolase
MAATFFRSERECGHSSFTRSVTVGLRDSLRRRLTGLDPLKAEVVLAGAVIHEAVMTQFGFDPAITSLRGLREGTPCLAP